MTTATVPLTIVCPDWCIETADEHARRLEDFDGCLDHRMYDAVITDTTGYIEPLAEPIMHSPIRVSFASLGRLYGGEAASPVLFINDVEHSIQQADELATALRTMIDTYRAAGGVA